MNVPILKGSGVALEPLTEAHRAPLRSAADDERIWVSTTVRADGDGFDGWFAEALSERERGRRFPFAVRRLADMKYVGSTSYLDITPKHRRLEIGATWYHPDSWGTVVNPECKLLLLTHAFEALEVQRVAFITDVLNRHSQAAIAKLGATREGVLRSHMVSQGDRIRDSVVFSIVAGEWPRIRQALRARIATPT
jgi:RimJ/RimL family protein N-acetyltransferase